MSAAGRPAFPLLGILGLIFITLKLCGTINWSWWGVLAPFWVPFALVAALAIPLGIVYLVATLCEDLGKSKSKRR